MILYLCSGVWKIYILLLTTKYEKQNVVAIDTTVPDTVGARRRKRRRRPRRDQSRADDTTDGFTLGAIGSIARHVRNSSRRRGRRVDPVPIGRRCVASGAYVNVAILDFGSALLRGMGWTGGSVDYPTNNSNRGGKGDRNGPVEKMANPRLHRLGLGAKPSLSPPSAGRGLNCIMIQMEGATKPASVAKDTVKLCLPEDIEKNLFRETRSGEAGHGGGGRNRSDDHVSGDGRRPCGDERSEDDSGRDNGR